MKLFKALLLIIFPLMVFSYSPDPPIDILSELTTDPDILKQMLDNEKLLSFDGFMNLLDKIERGDLDDCTPEDIEKIKNVLVFFTRWGTLPNASAEEKAELERDIQELLSPEEEDDESYEPLSYNLEEIPIVPAICHGGIEATLCKSWIKKAWSHTTHFIKKHKKAFIVGTVVLAAAAVVTTAVIISSTAAAAAAGAGGAGTAAISTKSSHKEHDAENKASSYQETIAQNNIIPPKTNPQDIRVVGSTLAHETLPSSYEIGHGKIDQTFSTDQSLHYLTQKPFYDTGLPKTVYQFQGEYALKQEHYTKAISDFSKTIELNPNNNEAYLDRAFAYLQTGNYDKSTPRLQDIHRTNTQISPHSL